VRGQHGRHKCKLEFDIRTLIKQTISKLLYWILLPHTGAKLANADVIMVFGFCILHCYHFKLAS
jgi:hypothetical protein